MMNEALPRVVPTYLASAEGVLENRLARERNRSAIHPRSRMPCLVPSNHRIRATCPNNSIASRAKFISMPDRIKLYSIGSLVAQSMRVRMKLSSVASLEAETCTALGRRPSVLEMEHSGVEPERHTESSSKLDGSTLLKISVKWRRLARKCQAVCDAWAT